MRMLYDREQVYQTIPPDTDIIINHSPPFGVLDWANRGCHAGCQALAQAVIRVRPRICISGHIHEDAGVSQVGETLYINASVLNKRYDVVNPAVIVEV